MSNSNNVINVLMIGDLIGAPGIEQVYFKLPQIIKKHNIDLTIANGENSDNGFGITEQIISQLKKSDIDVITSGNHIWSNNDAEKLLNEYDYLLRPHNYPDAAGKGYWLGEVAGVNIAIINLIGRYNMMPLDCPFQTLEKLLKRECKNSDIIIVDFHAELPTEKMALAYDFDGRISLLVGTHTHVQTADERLLPKGTGYITDLGMTGGIDSVIGMEKSSILMKIKKQINVPFVPSHENGKIQGIIAKINKSTKKTESIVRFNE